MHVTVTCMSSQHRFQTIFFYELKWKQNATASAWKISEARSSNNVTECIDKSVGSRTFDLKMTLYYPSLVLDHDLKVKPAHAKLYWSTEVSVFCVWLGPSISFTNNYKMQHVRVRSATSLNHIPSTCCLPILFRQLDDLITVK